jgi:diguanylate cyclase (GGDEF)-like protein
MTISIGLAIYPDQAKDENELISKADKALYDAKYQGRNRVISST